MTKIPSAFLFIYVICVVFVINFVFSGSLILAQTFSLGPFTIHYYGLIMALAVAGGFYLAVKASESYGLTKKQAEDILFWVIIGGFIGARLYHVLSSFGYYQHNVIDILKVWNGGLSIYGAVLGGLVSVLIYQKGAKGHLWHPLLNWLTPSLIFGQIMGRFGNLFNYEAFGYPTNLPWKMFVPAGFRPNEYLNFNFFHPWFLYEQIGLIVILFIINRLEKSSANKSSTSPQPSPRQEREPNMSLFLYYLLLYNILRFGLEFLRIDSTIVNSFRLNSFTSLIFILIIITFFIKMSKYDKNDENDKNIAA